MAWQGWFCTACGKRGNFPIYSFDGAISIAQRIEEEHKKMSPDCPNSKDPEGWKKLSEDCIPYYGR
jgi:hypothetical protein